MNRNFQYLRYKTIDGREAGSHLVVLAGVHGDEYEPMAAARSLLKVVSDVLKTGRVTIVPIVNLFAFSRGARTGEDSLDLARICPGNPDGSPSEILAAELSRLISEADYLIDLHGGGNTYEIDPLAGYVLHDVPDVLEKQRQMARAFNLKTVWGTSNKLNGRTLSVARDNNVPAIYTEFGGGGGFKKAVVDEYIQGCLNVMSILGMSETSMPEIRTQFELEDYREESGHLQILLPAPMEGLFEPSVGLGDFVKKNDPIGIIADPFGEKITPALADQDGMVFMVRAVPSVKKGDTLGGILPVTQPGKFQIL